MSGSARLLRCRKDLRQFAEIPGGGGEEEFVTCAAWATQSEPPQAEDTFEVSKEHLDLFAQAHRDGVLSGLGDIARDLAGIFVFFAGDGAEIGVGAAA